MFLYTPITKTSQYATSNTFVAPYGHAKAKSVGVSKMSDYDKYVPSFVGNGLLKSFVRKVVSSVVENRDAYMLEFTDEKGEPPFVGRGMVLPKSLGFVPTVGMKAIYDRPDYVGADGEVSFYDNTGKLLFDIMCIGGNWIVTNKNPVLPGKIKEKVM
jgi:hypothetical protein